MTNEVERTTKWNLHGIARNAAFDQRVSAQKGDYRDIEAKFFEKICTDLALGCHLGVILAAQAGYVTPKVQHGLKLEAPEAPRRRPGGTFGDLVASRRRPGGTFGDLVVSPRPARRRL